MTALFWRPLEMISLTAQSKPAMMMEVAVSVPWKTLTSMRFAFLATPKVAPPIVPATWVPWPAVSSYSPSYAVQPWEARPSNSR